MYQSLVQYNHNGCFVCRTVRTGYWILTPRYVTMVVLFVFIFIYRDDYSRAVPSTGFSIGIGPIPAFLVVSELVKYVTQVRIYYKMNFYVYIS